MKTEEILGIFLVIVILTTLSLFVLTNQILFIGVLITAIVALVISILTVRRGNTNNHDNDYNSRMILGEPPTEWPVEVNGERVMGERIGMARLDNPREMMSIGPMSNLRLNPRYHYILERFANYAGLYRVPK